MKLVASKIMLDNESNFVGADNEFRELKEFLVDPKNQSEVMNFASNQLIE